MITIMAVYLDKAWNCINLNGPIVTNSQHLGISINDLGPGGSLQKLNELTNESCHIIDTLQAIR